MKKHLNKSVCFDYCFHMQKAASVWLMLWRFRKYLFQNISCRSYLFLVQLYFQIIFIFTYLNHLFPYNSSFFSFTVCFPAFQFVGIINSLLGHITISISITICILKKKNVLWKLYKALEMSPKICILLRLWEYFGIQLLFFGLGGYDVVV